MRRNKSSKRGKKSIVIASAFLCITFNLFLMHNSRNPVDPAYILYIAPESKRQMSWPRQDLFTMAPRDSSENTVGMVHVGKTAGSTISQLLRNGCTSFVTGTCRNITNESEVSRRVEHYYHVPDFHRLPTANHYAFIISVRDVYERTVSSFLYHHPKNAAINQVKLTKMHGKYGPKAYACFDTLDDFASLLNGVSSPDQCHYPHPFNVIDASDCAALACAALHGKARFFIHLYFNYRNILYSKLPKDPSRQLYAIRQEFLWKDWENLNIMWGQKDPVYIPHSHFNQRNISGLALPIGKAISPQGRRHLCTALQDEYEAYFRILYRSKNLGPEDMEASLQVSEKRCPNLDLRGMVSRLK